MSKGLLFWIIWILCILSFGGVLMFGWPSIYSAGVMLVLFGLLGWHCFGIPGWTEKKERDYLRRIHKALVESHNRATGHSHATLAAVDFCNLTSEP